MKKLITKLVRHLSKVLVRFEKSDNTVFMKTAVERVNKWMEDKGYCVSDLSMSKLCNNLGISKYELSWVCKSVYGENFLTLRKRMRIIEAQKLLVENPDTPFVYIGERVGIPDRTNFRRQFFEITGQTPGEYRKSHNR